MHCSLPFRLNTCGCCVTVVAQGVSPRPKDNSSVLESTVLPEFGLPPVSKQPTLHCSLCSCAGLSLRSGKRVRSRRERTPTCTASRGPSGGWHWPSLRRSVGRQRPHDKPLRTLCCWQLAANRWACLAPVCLGALRMIWSPVSSILRRVSCSTSGRYCPNHHPGCFDIAVSEGMQAATHALHPT